MRKLSLILILTFASAAAFACGPAGLKVALVISVIDTTTRLKAGSTKVTFICAEPATGYNR